MLEKNIKSNLWKTAVYIRLSQEDKETRFDEGAVSNSVINQQQIIDEEVAPVVRDIFKWYAEDLGKIAIVQRLNGMGIPSPAKYRTSNYPPKKIIVKNMLVGLLVYGAFLI